MTYLVGPQELYGPLCQLSPSSGRRGGEKVYDLPSRTSGAIQPSVPAIPDLWEKDIRPSWGGAGTDQQLNNSSS